MSAAMKWCTHGEVRFHLLDFIMLQSTCCAGRYVTFRQRFSCELSCMQPYTLSDVTNVSAELRDVSNFRV